DSPRQKISIADLQRVFSHNPIITMDGVLYNDMYLPPGSILTAPLSEGSEKPYVRRIVITNPYLTLTITSQFPSYMFPQHGIWGILARDAYDLNIYGVFHFLVSIQTTLSRTKTYSAEMDSYKRWHENIAAALSKFDWSEVARQAEEDLNRKTISKTLGLPE